MSKCKKKNCGCKDKALTTPPPCTSGTSACPNPDPCAETFSAGCIVFTGDTIADTNIRTGERLNVILQRFSLLLTNPDCVDPDNACQSALGLRSTDIYTTSINLAWETVVSAINYQVEYREVGDPSWTLLIPTSLNYASIGALNPDTAYYIRVNTICSVGNCYSVTIVVNTKPS